MKLPVDNEFLIGDMDYKLFLKVLNGQSGIYHLWIDHEHCDDHDTHTMLGVYVGKGPPDIRITSHIKDRWPDVVELYSTFTPMKNRLSKYYEQLFLDSYDFILNRAENIGTEKLYAVWDHERYCMGTHLNEVSNISKMRGFDVTGVLRPHCLPFLIFACRRIGLLTLDMRARLSYYERVDRAGPVMGSRRTSRIRHSRNFVALGQVDEDTWQRVQVAGRVKSIAESRR